jgi:hypothetical protein
MHWRNIANSKSIVGIFLIGVFSYSCNNEQVKFNDGTKNHQRCDTSFYLIKNEDTGLFIDSILTNKSVGYCYFDYSELSDTVMITFIYGKDVREYFAKNYPSNRFLKNRNKLIRVISKEDFFLKEDRFIDNVRLHPYFIKIKLADPGLELIDWSIYEF